MHLTSSLFLCHHCYGLESGPYFLTSALGHHLLNWSPLPARSSRWLFQRCNLISHPIPSHIIPSHPINKHFLSADHGASPLLATRDTHVNQTQALSTRKTVQGEEGQGGRERQESMTSARPRPGDYGSPEESISPRAEERVKRRLP